MHRTPGYLEREFDLSGGVLCLDYANTVNRRRNPNRLEDLLPGYSDLVMFARQSGLVSPQQARGLVATGLQDCRKVTSVMRTADILRETIYRIFSDVASGRPPQKQDVRKIKEFDDEAMKHHSLVAFGRGFQWRWRYTKDNTSLGSVLWPIAQSATGLMTSERLQLVRQCQADECAWLFLDESRNHSRRWCDMKTCGNRQKARRHYALKQR
jgi:predicted RNA-binding Zn ribbon-like protein